MSHHEAIIEALVSLGGEGTIKEVNYRVNKMYPGRWKDTGTTLADMVPTYLGGNTTSTIKDEYRILERVSPGKYRLIS